MREKYACVAFDEPWVGSAETLKSNYEKQLFEKEKMNLVEMEHPKDDSKSFGAKE
jgi:hypothetical protein